MTLAVTAENYAFAPTSLSLQAGSILSIAFTNRDDAVQHSVAIKKAGGTLVFNPGTPVMGVTTTVYRVGALKAGAYTFYCTVHPTMTGILTVR